MASSTSTKRGGGFYIPNLGSQHEVAYPDLPQRAMRSLCALGNAMRVADSIAANRAKMQTNDIIPWLSTVCYGEYAPSHTRDMILETFANGARGTKVTVKTPARSQTPVGDLHSEKEVGALEAIGTGT